MDDVELFDPDSEQPGSPLPPPEPPRSDERIDERSAGPNASSAAGAEFPGAEFGGAGFGGAESAGAESTSEGSFDAGVAPARWARSDDRVVLGVAGGLGDALGLDPLLVRLGFVAVSALSPAGIPAYIAGWLLLRQHPFGPPVSSVRRVIGAVVAGLSIAGLLSSDGPTFGGNFLVAAILIGVAFAIWGPRRPDSSAPAGPIRAGANPVGAAVGWRTAAEGMQDGLREAVEGVRESVEGLISHRGEPTRHLDERSQRRSAAAWQTPARTRRPRRPRSPLGRLGLAAAIIGAVLVFMLNGRDAQAATWAFGTASLILGIAALIGVFWGRARWLVIPGLVAVTGALGAEAIDWTGVPFTTTDYDNYEQPATAADVRPSYQYGFVDMELDLGSTSGDITTSIKGGIGDIRVYVPTTARVEITARAGAGSIQLPDQSSSDGHHRSSSTVLGPEGADQRITLDLAIGIGAISVYRIDPNDAFPNGWQSDGHSPTTVLYPTVPVEPEPLAPEPPVTGPFATIPVIANPAPPITTLTPLAPVPVPSAVTTTPQPVEPPTAPVTTEVTT